MPAKQARRRVFANLATSLDGKIGDTRLPGKGLGTARDRREMQRLRKMADAVLVGAKTVALHSEPMSVKGAARQPANVVISASGRLDPESAFWQSTRNIRFVFTTEEGMPEALLASRDRAFVVAAGSGQVDLHQVLARLEEAGLRNILVEGGGETISAFLEADLLDEIFVTLTPWLVGGRKNPSLVGGEGLVPWRGLRLKKARKIGDEMYFHYLVQKRKRK
jgi:riboflavin-specific deaminase-like protein